MIMKNIGKFILTLFAICAGLTSCVKEDFSGNENDGLVTFKATYEPSTKTVLNGLTPYWTPSEKIAVFNGVNNEFTATVSEPSATAIFKGELAGKGTKNFRAVTPYSPDYTYSSLGSTFYGLSIPQEQTCVENTYDPEALVAIAQSDDHNLSFKNLGSLVKFTIISDGVTSVTLRSNNEEVLSGTFEATYSANPGINVREGVCEVTVKGDFKKGSTYYAVTLPADLEKGFIVLLNGSVKSMSVDAPVMLSRSGLVNLGKLSINPGESQMPESGEDEEGTSGIVYLKPNSKWLEQNARFSVYFFEGDANTWVSMTDDDSNGIYECSVPSGYTNMIFVRLNPASTDNCWDDGVKWGQTADLKVPVDANICYVLDADSWDSGHWTSYPPTVSEPDPTPGPGEGEDGQVIYLNTGGTSLWDQAGAWFEAWSWCDNAEGSWYKMTSVGSGIYQCTVPEENKNIIFVRRGPDMTTGWDADVHYWNKTDDLAIPSGCNCYTITGWGGAEGTWSTR